MSTWSQYFLAQRKEEKVRQVTFLCGSEPVLIEWVIDHIVRLVGVEPWNFTSLIAGEDSERELWAELERHPIDRGARLVILRNAERLAHKERLVDWIQNRTKNPRTFLIIVENSDRVPTVPATERGKKASPAPHVAAASRSGTVVECRSFTQATAKHAVSWVRSIVFMQENVAGHLLNRANGDLRLVRDTCLKLSVLEEAPTIPLIDAMLSQRPRVEFREALLQRRKKEALFALQRVSPDDYSRIIGALDADLDLVGLVYDLQNQHKTAGEMAKAAGKMAFLVPRVQPYAKHYDPKRRTALRGLLATADEAIRGGERVGVLEGLVAQW